MAKESTRGLSPRRGISIGIMYERVKPLLARAKAWRDRSSSE
jgi:hypothetical protein